MALKGLSSLKKEEVISSLPLFDRYKLVPLKQCDEEHRLLS